MSYAIVTLSPPGYIHVRCFDEVALTLQRGLEALGERVSVGWDAVQTGARPIVLGPDLYAGPPEGLPRDCILYNLEQLCSGEAPVPRRYLDLLWRYQVWDFSAANCAWLAARGVGAVHVPLGYVPDLERIPHAHPDLDVVFVGSVSPRRAQVLQRLRQARLKVGAAFALYGKPRDALYARARVVLNMHHAPHNTFEQVRVSYLLANARFVVSETSTPEEDEPWRAGVAFADYESIVETCQQYVRDDHARRRIAHAGQFLMRLRPMRTILRRALDTTSTTATRPSLHLHREGEP